MNPGAILVLKSNNAKIGRAAATYASIESTCPPCPLKGEGCYAQMSQVGFTVVRLDRAKRTALQCAKDEAAALDAARDVRDLPLRMHVSGDAKTPAAARILGAAAGRWLARGGSSVWTYTHAWQRVKRSDWGPVSVLASVETVAQGKEAIRAGYAPARVVAQHPADGRAYDESGVRWIPCPEQTRGVTCTECRLCFDGDALLKRGAGIAFAVHGQGSKRVLKVIQ